MLLAVDFDEYLINVERVAEASVFSFQSSTVYSTEFDAPETDRLSADGDASLGQKVFNVAVAKIESIVEPDGITDDVAWKSVSLISIHLPILAIWAS